MEFSERVLILKIGRFKESDLWVKFLSPTRGIVTAFAFGGARSRRRFGGCLDVLNIVLIRAEQSKRQEFLHLTEGTLIDGPQRLRTDHNRARLAMNCLKFLEALHISPEGASAAYNLALDMLRAMEQLDETPGAFSLYFRAHAAFTQGYDLELEHCAECSTSIERDAVYYEPDLCGEFSGPYAEDSAVVRPFYFLIEKGMIVCDRCHTKTCGLEPGEPFGSPGLRISPGAVKVLKYIRDHGPREWGRLRLSEAHLQECSRAVDMFVEYHLGLSWNQTHFRSV